ncbi:MAG: Flp pilus assembly complex ATPase component TadA [Alphaproteobacteria bacterium]|nr:Flp pilus assembly complex ATPase component TadA [Alphaproteobacteria bacterium]
MAREITKQSFLAFSEILASLLLEKGILSSDQLDVAFKEQKLQKIPFEECLLNLGFLSEAALTEVLSVASGYSKICLKTTLLDPVLRSLFPQEIARSFSMIPLSLEDGILQIALSDIYNLPALDYLRHKVPGIQDVVLRLASETDIREAIDHYYGYDLSIPGLLKEIESSPSQAYFNDNYESPTVRLVNAILIDGIKMNASDIHFEPEGAFVRLRYRIDGILSQICTLHSSYWPSICVRLKVMTEMNIAESRRPQNGRMTFTMGPREIDLRVASHPTIHGENIVVRILDKSRSLLALHQLGYSQNIIEQIKASFLRPDGIFIITGPTGCGKTTSLYSMLNYMSTPEINIMTLEEPVEYQIPLIRQSDVRDQSRMNFTDGIRSILRQDPDIILIGEIRDSGTAQMALRAAMTGHQVFSTLHTNDALGAIPRLIDLGLTRPMLAGSLMGIIAQRLVRKLCPLCRTEKEISSSEAILLNSFAKKTFFLPKGCPSCRNTGYQGRVAIAEILIFDTELDELLLNTSSRSTLSQVAEKKGYIPMKEEARRRVLEGDTSLEEILKTVDLREGA